MKKIIITIICLFLISCSQYTEEDNEICNELGGTYERFNAAGTYFCNIPDKDNLELKRLHSSELQYFKSNK